MLIPYDAEHYRMRYCWRKAKELRASGDYKKVIVKEERAEWINGCLVPFGSIWVEDKEKA